MVLDVIKRGHDDISASQQGSLFTLTAESLDSFARRISVHRRKLSNTETDIDEEDDGETPSDAPDNKKRLIAKYRMLKTEAKKRLRKLSNSHKIQRKSFGIFVQQSTIDAQVHCEEYSSDNYSSNPSTSGRLIGNRIDPNYNILERDRDRERGRENDRDRIDRENEKTNNMLPTDFGQKWCIADNGIIDQTNSSSPERKNSTAGKLLWEASYSASRQSRLTKNNRCCTIS